MASFVCIVRAIFCSFVASFGTGSGENLQTTRDAATSGCPKGMRKDCYRCSKTYYQFKPADGTTKAQCDSCDNADALTAETGWSIHKKPDTENQLKKRLDQVNSIVDKVKTRVQEYEDKKGKPCTGTNTGGHCICTRKEVDRKSTPVSKCYHGFTFDSNLNICVARNDNGADCSPACTAGGNLGKECPEFCPANKRYCCKQGTPGVCARAVYVKLDFTQGSPSDYYQCVSPAIVIGGPSTQLFEEPLEVGILVRQESPQESSSLLLQRASLGAEGAHRSLSSLERSTSRKGDTKEPAAAPNGAASPVCDPNGLFTEELTGQGGKCFEECASGFDSVLTDEDGDNPRVPTIQCIQSCKFEPLLRAEGMFGIAIGNAAADSLTWKVCATTTSFASTAMSESLEVLKDVVTAVVTAIQLLAKNSDLTQVELDTVSEELGKAFTHFVKPECGEEPETPVPAPGPDPR